MPVLSVQETEYVYDKNHPMNVADRALDPDDGIDYDEIIATTEPDFRAGRGWRFETMAEFRVWFREICQGMPHHETKPSKSRIS